MRKFIIVLTTILVVISNSLVFADREQDLMTQLKDKTLQIQSLQAQLEQARREEQQLVGMIMETQRLKKEAKKEIPNE